MGTGWPHLGGGSVKPRPLADCGREIFSGHDFKTTWRMFLGGESPGARVCDPQQRGLRDMRGKANGVIGF